MLYLALPLLAGLAGTACQELPVREKAVRSVPRYDAETFYETTSLFGASFSPDGQRLLLTSDASGVYNAYSIPVGGGKLTQLTDSNTDAVLTIGWFHTIIDCSSCPCRRTCTRCSALPGRLQLSCRKPWTTRSPSLPRFSGFWRTRRRMSPT